MTNSGELIPHDPSLLCPESSRLIQNSFLPNNKCFPSQMWYPLSHQIKTEYEQDTSHSDFVLYLKFCGVKQSSRLAGATFSDQLNEVCNGILTLKRSNVTEIRFLCAEKCVFLISRFFVLF